MNDAGTEKIRCTYVVYRQNLKKLLLPYPINDTSTSFKTMNDLSTKRKIIFMYLSRSY